MYYVNNIIHFVSLFMSQTIIDNINNYSMEIVDNSLILTPKGNIASHIIKIGRTILCNDKKYIIKYFMGTYLSTNKPLRIVSYNEKNVNSFEIFNINTNTIIDVDVDENIIIHKK